MRKLSHLPDKLINLFCYAAMGTPVYFWGFSHEDILRRFMG